MKRSEIYLKAISKLKSQSLKTGCCFAISNVPGHAIDPYSFPHKSIPELWLMRNTNAKTFQNKKCPGYWLEDVGFSPTGNREIRMWCLLFAHEIAKSNGN